VRVGDELFVRSYRGPTGTWLRHALERQEGRIKLGDLEPAVAFEQAAAADHAAIDDAYRRKYARHGATYVKAMVTPTVAATTPRLTPR
jgi:hypothetical protein